MRLLKLLPLALAVVLLGCRNKPPTASAPSGPTALRTAASGSFTATANDPEASAIALRFDWGNSDTSAWSDWLASGDTATADHAWATSGSYGVRAQARDVNELLSAWSAPLTVTVSDTFNRAPSVSVSGPDTGFIGIAYQFFASVTDPDSDSVCVRFACDHDDTTQWLGPLPSGTSLAYPDSWTTGGPHWVAAQAKDAFGVQSAWSAPCTITISLEGTVKWVADIACGFGVCPAIGPGGTIYVASLATGLQAVNPDGTIAWSVSLDAATSPVLHADRLYVCGWDGGDGMAAAFTTSGTELWRRHARTMLPNAPAVGVDGAVYFNTSDSMIALNPDGSLRWAHSGRGGTRSSCALGPDGTVYTGVGRDSLFAFYPDGSVKWRIPNTPGYYVPFELAIGADGTLYLHSLRNSQDGLLALNPDGTDKWFCPTPQPLEAGPVIDPDGTIYSCGERGKLLAFSPDGTLKWTFAAREDEETGTPAARADGVVCFAVGGGEICAVNPDGTPRWRTRPQVDSWHSPLTIMPDGTLLYGDDGQWLVALHGSSPLADSPWPKFQRDLQNSGRAR